MTVKKILSVVLVLGILLGILSGCGAGTQSTESVASVGSEETQASVPEETAQEPVVEDAAAEEPSSSEEASSEMEEEPEREPSYTVPLSDETLEYSIWIAYAPFIGNLIDSMNDLSVIKGIQDTLNVHFDITAVNGADEENNFRLMIASNDYCDILTSTIRYATGLEGAVDDGVLMDLAPYVQEYMPIYYSKLSADRNSLLRATTDSGYMPAICTLLPEPGQEAMGMIYRDDWLADFGMSEPKTFDDLYDYLSKAHTEKGAVMNLSNTKGSFGDLAAGLNFALDGYYVIDDEVHYGNMGEDFKYYLKYMNRLYEEGILDHDFYSTTAMDPSSVARQNFGMGLNPLVTTSAANTKDVLTYADNPDDISMAVLPYVTRDGKTDVHIAAGNNGDIIKNDDAWAFNAELSLDEAKPLFEMVEYFFSDDGYLLTNYGIEGEAYTLDENGDPQWTDLVINNPDGLSFLFAGYIYATNNATGHIPFVNDLRRLFYDFNDMQWQIFDDLKTLSDGAYNYPQFAAMTTDESIAYNEIETAVSTYAETTILQFITGALDIDENYDAYEQTLFDMGLQDMIDLKQDAYDRGIARANGL